MSEDQFWKLLRNHFPINFSFFLIECSRNSLRIQKILKSLSFKFSPTWLQFKLNQTDIPTLFKTLDNVQTQFILLATTYFAQKHSSRQSMGSWCLLRIIVVEVNRVEFYCIFLQIFEKLFRGKWLYLPSATFFLMLFYEWNVSKCFFYFKW